MWELALRTSVCTADAVQALALAGRRRRRAAPAPSRVVCRHTGAVMPACARRPTVGRHAADRTPAYGQPYAGIRPYAGVRWAAYVGRVRTYGHACIGKMMGNPSQGWEPWLGFAGGIWKLGLRTSVCTADAVQALALAGRGRRRAAAAAPSTAVCRHPADRARAYGRPCAGIRPAARQGAADRPQCLRLSGVPVSMCPGRNPAGVPNPG